MATLVNELTGETSTLPELLEQLRSVERAIQRLDDTIATYSGELKAAKKDRDKAVAELRSLAREVRLLEAARVRRAKSGRVPAGR